jgi:hypothetical protein
VDSEHDMLYELIENLEEAFGCADLARVQAVLDQAKDFSDVPLLAGSLQKLQAYANTLASAGTTRAGDSDYDNVFDEESDFGSVSSEESDTESTPELRALRRMSLIEATEYLQHKAVVSPKMLPVPRQQPHIHRADTSTTSGSTVEQLREQMHTMAAEHAEHNQRLQNAIAAAERKLESLHVQMESMRSGYEIELQNANKQLRSVSVEGARRQGALAASGTEVKTVVVKHMDAVQLSSTPGSAPASNPYTSPSEGLPPTSMRNLSSTQQLALSPETVRPGGSSSPRSADAMDRSRGRGRRSPSSPRAHNTVTTSTLRSVGSTTTSAPINLQSMHGASVKGMSQAFDQGIAPGSTLSNLQAQGPTFTVASTASSPSHAGVQQPYVSVERTPPRFSAVAAQSAQVHDRSTTGLSAPSRHHKLNDAPPALAAARAEATLSQAYADEARRAQFAAERRQAATDTGNSHPSNLMSLDSPATTLSAHVTGGKPHADSRPPLLPPAMSNAAAQAICGTQSPPREQQQTRYWLSKQLKQNSNSMQVNTIRTAWVF